MSAVPNPTDRPFNTRHDLSDSLDVLWNHISGDVNIDGTLVPRYGALSLLARRVPAYVTDHPDMIKLFGGTAMTNGSYVFFAAPFLEAVLQSDIDSSSKRQRTEDAIPLCLHELMHILLMHVGDPALARMTGEGYDRDEVNIAQDIYININVKKGLGEQVSIGPILSATGYGFTAEEARHYAGMSEEGIYRARQAAGEAHKPGDLDAEALAQAIKNGQVQVKPGKGRGKGKDQPDMGHDHLLNNETLVDALQQAGLGHVIEKLDLPLNPEQAQKQHEQQVLRLVDDVTKAQAMSNGVPSDKYPGGHITSMAAERIKLLGKAELNWRSQLGELIQGDGMQYVLSDEVPSDLYYVNPEDMGFGAMDALYLPAPIPAAPDHVTLILFDWSASVDRQLAGKFLQECFGLVENAQSYIGKVIALHSDTVLRGEPMVLDANSYQEYLKDPVIYGRGGTNLTQVLCDALALPLVQREKIRSLIYFTDLGDAPPPRDRLPANLPPVTYVTDDANYQESWAQAVADYAQVIRIRPDVTVDLDRPARTSPRP